jgi:succinate dehydrogenase/fumarate reductase cytochrome b subunit
MDAFLQYVNTRFKGEINDEVNNILQLFLICKYLHEAHLIDRFPSHRVYQTYLFYCEIYNCAPVSHIAFSRFLCQWFPYETTVRHMFWDKGKAEKIRCYRRKLEQM